jgi:transposase-like protein
MKERRKYNKELKAEAIKMIVGQGLSQAEVGQRLSIPKGTIGTG